MGPWIPSSSGDAAKPPIVQISTPRMASFRVAAIQLNNATLTKTQLWCCILSLRRRQYSSGSKSISTTGFGVMKSSPPLNQHFQAITHSGFTACGQLGDPPSAGQQLRQRQLSMVRLGLCCSAKESIGCFLGAGGREGFREHYPEYICHGKRQA